MYTFLFRYGRRCVYALALLWAFFCYWQASVVLPSAPAGLAYMVRMYGLTALFLIFATLTPGLILSYAPRFKWNGLFIHLRRAVGVSVFFFAVLHGSMGFFHNLTGNISSLLFLSPRHQWALIVSGIAFVIFSLLAMTSFDRMVRILGSRWKKLHRFVYLAAILTLFHAFLIGSHFTNPKAVVPGLVNGLALLFIVLEVGATLKRGWKKILVLPLFKKATVFVLALSVVGLACYLSAQAWTNVYDPHARHRKGYSKDYTLNLNTEPPMILPQMPVTLTFDVTDKRTGATLTKYQILQEKLMHVVVIRKDLLYYDHIHPDYDNKGAFSITTTFPTEGTYYLFVEYSPPDFVENLSVASIKVGDPKEERAGISPDARTKTFNDRYEVTLAVQEPIRVNEAVDFVYALKDADTGEPIDDLQTYLAAFGHMSAVSEDAATYTHVHPITVPLSPTDPGGPTVAFNTFFPKAGKYKLFTQFKHNEEIFVTDFVVEVQ